MAAVMMSVLLSYYLYYLHLIVLAALVSRIAGPMGFSRSALSMFYSCSAENIARGNFTIQQYLLTGLKIYLLL